MSEPRSDLVPDTPDRPATCGYVALVGLPNAGKSTLLNALIGESLSIVTAKPQTTQRRVAGIRTEGPAQYIFLDTPGILPPANLFHSSLGLAVQAAVREADVVLFLFDQSRGHPDEEWVRLEEAVKGYRGPLVVLGTKADLTQARETMERAKAFADRRGAPFLAVAPPQGTGIDELLRVVAERLPEGPFLYPEEDLASEPLRFFVAELVRETMLEQYHEEIPYASLCHVEEYRDDPERTFIHVMIYVERESQKGIVVGKGGGAIRELGIASRRKIEALLGGPVYLDLRVKVLPGWRKKRGQLSRFGFALPPE